VIKRLALASAFAALASQHATAQDWVTTADSIAGLINATNLGPGTSLLLNARSDLAPNDLIVQDDYSWLAVGGDRSGWENTTWAGTAAGVKEPVGFLTFGPDDDYDLTMRAVTLRDVDMQMGSIEFPANAGRVRLDFQAASDGDPISLTLDNASVAFDRDPLWRAVHPLTIAATGGTNVITDLKGNQAPKTTINVASGSTLEFFGSGQIGSGIPDSQRLNFEAPDNSADVDGGTLDINLSHLIFPTGATEEMVVRNGGQLQITGGESTLETGGLRVDGSTLQMGAGGTKLEVTDGLELNDATVDLNGGATAETSVTRASGTTNIALNDNPTTLSTGGLVVSGAGSQLTLSGEGVVETPTVAFFSADNTTALNITDEAELIVNPGGVTSAWRSGSLNLADADARLVVQDGARVQSSIPIQNGGGIVVRGDFEPDGTMSGDGFMRIENGGEFGLFSGDVGATYTVSPDLFMEAASTLQLLIDPSQQLAQLLTVESLFTLDATLGVFLDMVLVNDQLLTDGITFPIVDYEDGNDLGGRFMGADFSPYNEGDIVLLGLNRYRLSYRDTVYDPNNTSLITLTVDNTVPVPASIALAALGLAGLGAVRGFRRRRVA
jgi:hypothetical protein